MRRPGVLAAAATLALAGCGQPADADRARRAAEGVLLGLEVGDGRAVCDRLSERGRAELALLAVEAQAGPDAVRPADPATCERLAREVGRALRRVGALPGGAVRAVHLHRRKAAIDTDRGTLEAHERGGRWRLTRLTGLALALERGRPGGRAVVLEVLRPPLTEPALGEVLAGRVTEGSVVVHGRLHPPGARVRVEALAGGGTVREVRASEGDLRLELRLRRGRNVFRLEAEAPGREPAELVLELDRPVAPGAERG